MQSITELWLTAGGHSLWEHLSGESIPWRKVAWDRYALSDPRAETLLCGLLYFFPDEARQAGARVGLESWHFRNKDAAAVWRGESRPDYERHTRDEYSLALDAIVDEEIKMHLHGQQTPCHDAGPGAVAEALGSRLVQVHEARTHLQEAERLLRGTEVVRTTSLGGVIL